MDFTVTTKDGIQPRRKKSFTIRPYLKILISLSMIAGAMHHRVTLLLPGLVTIASAGWITVHLVSFLPSKFCLRFRD